jgi:hypothetical protein
MKPLKDLPPEEAFLLIFGKLHLRWRLAILLPAVYFLIVVWLVQGPLADGGLVEISDLTLMVLMVVGVAFVFFLWRLLTSVRRVQQRDLSTAHMDPVAFLDLAKRQQLVQLTLCDLSSAPGLILFALRGEPMLAIPTLVLSMVMYLRVLPSQETLGEAYFRTARH